MGDTAPPRMAYRPDVDGLRAVAVLSVVAYHAGVPWVPGGFVGVDVFFVISGFLITGLLDRELSTTGTISISAFYARRIRRLLPALSVVLVASVLFGLAVYPKLGELGTLTKSVAAAILISANQYFYATSGGYFDLGTGPRPLVHLWSLSVEEQYYLVWPLLLLTIARQRGAGDRVPWTRGVLGALVLASFGFNVLRVRDHPTAAFFLAPSRAWELGVGALLALLPAEPDRRVPRMGVLAGGIGVTLILVGCVSLTASSPYPGWAALLPVLGTALVILGNGQAPASPLARLLGARLPVAIGLCAYGWYLWHWPLLAFAHHLSLGEHHLGPDIGLALAALGLAALSLRWIERPFYRRDRQTSTPPWHTIRVGLGVMAMLLLFSLSVGAYGKWGPKSPAEWRARAVLMDRRPPSDDCDEVGPEWGDLPRFTHCRVGGRHRPALVIWGDSHAEAWAPLLDSAMQGPEDAYLILSHGSCPPGMGLTPRRKGGIVITNCIRFNQAAVTTLQRLAAQGMTGVILAARWPAYGGAGDLPVLQEGISYADSSDRSPAAALTSLRVALDSTLTLLQASRLRVLVLLTPPELRYLRPLCSVRRPVESCGIDRATYLGHAAPTWSVVREVAAHQGNVRVIDPTDFFCDARYCPPFVRGHPIVFDADHVTASAASAFGTTIREELEWVRGG